MKEIIMSTALPLNVPDCAARTTDTNHDTVAVIAMACQRYGDHRMRRNRPAAVTRNIAASASHTNTAEESAHHAKYADMTNMKLARRLRAMVALRSNV